MDALGLYAASRSWRCFALRDVSMGRGWESCVPLPCCVVVWTVPVVASAHSGLQG